MKFNHIPVLLPQVIEYLNIKPGNKYIDATLGGGGHSKEIVNRGGVVLGIDQDQEALEQAKSVVLGPNFRAVYGNFKDLGKLSRENGFTMVSGILFDLGVSSYQLEKDERGFSLKRNGPLDMRMDANSQIKASDIVNSYSEAELTDIFQRYGEEERAQAAAHQIVEKRAQKRFETTGELISALALILKKEKFIHPATKIFQALRIEVNLELDALKAGLNDSLNLLGAEGVVLVISFHSLEDRITKRIFTDWEVKGLGNALTKKPITADSDEVRSNPRARSAKLRIFKKK